MTIFFTEEELKWIDKKPFAWKVKKGCPDSIRQRLKRKIAQFYNGEHYNYERSRKR